MAPAGHARAAQNWPAPPREQTPQLLLRRRRVPGVRPRSSPPPLSYGWDCSTSGGGAAAPTAGLVPDLRPPLIVASYTLSPVLSISSRTTAGSSHGVQNHVFPFLPSTACATHPSQKCRPLLSLVIGLPRLSCIPARLGASVPLPWPLGHALGRCPARTADRCFSLPAHRDGAAFVPTSLGQSNTLWALVDCSPRTCTVSHRTVSKRLERKAPATRSVIHPSSPHQFKKESGSYVYF